MMIGFSGIEVRGRCDQGGGGLVILVGLVVWDAGVNLYKFCSGQF